MKRNPIHSHPGGMKMTKTEQIIRKAVTEGKDPFIEVASEMYAIHADSVTKMQRQMAKASAYQYLYAGGAGTQGSDLKEVFHRG
jgi:DNA polymerase I-like protein with 3'-5' exonuclease and polymerase domains